MPKEYQPIEYYLEKVGNPKSYQELLEDYAVVLARLRSYESIAGQEIFVIKPDYIKDLKSKD